MYKARVVQALAFGAALSLAVAGCAQNPEATGEDGKKGKTDQAAGSQQVEITPDEPPAIPSDVVLPKGDGKAQCKDVTIAYIGTIAGGNPALGRNIYQGAELAVNEHNKANPNCQVKFRKFDSEGSPDKAPGVVTQAIADKSIIGVVGLPFSGESKAVGGTFNQAGLVAVSPAATNPDLAKNGWKTFFRGLGNDAVQGPAIAKFLTETLKAEKVCVIQDDSEYGIGLATQVSDTLGDKAECQEKIKTGQKEFSSVIGSIQSEQPDAVFFSGYYAEGGPFAQQMRDAGIEAAFVGPDGVRDAEFVKNAGTAAEGAYLSCPCLPSAGFKDFYDAYRAAYNEEPSTYSPEAYDVATILLQGIDKGVKTRKEMLDFVTNYKGRGLTKFFEFDENGEVKEVPVWIYTVKDGEITHLKDVSVK